MQIGVSDFVTLAGGGFVKKPQIFVTSFKTDPLPDQLDPDPNKLLWPFDDETWEKKSKKSENKASTSKDSAAKRKNSEASAIPSRRKTKMRKAASEKTGNLASEILDMLLSASEESEGEHQGSEESSDESWK